MYYLITTKLLDPQFMFALFVAIAAAATVYTLAQPLLVKDDLRRRMKSVGEERSKLRTQDRDRLSKEGAGRGLRHNRNNFLQNLSSKYSLQQFFGVKGAKERLAMAGYRSRNAEVVFTFARLVVPLGLFLVVLIYLFGISPFKLEPLAKITIALVVTYIGLKLPELYITNIITKRQLSMRRAWPDASDMMLICVESGMAVEESLRKVYREIGGQSVELAEELALTVAELSYLPDRRMAYENLGARTGVEGIKSTVTSLIQAERYGTPIGTALRVLSQESRDQRMNEAEKKAAALPPKLTVPMIIFFLPVLFIIIMTPAVIQVSNLK
jgi:tight adherence protein C